MRSFTLKLYVYTSAVLLALFALSGCTDTTPKVESLSSDFGVMGFSVSSVSLLEGTSATFTISLSNPSTSSETVDWFLTSGTATNPADYAGPTTGTLVFAPGETSKTITLSTIDDSIVCEADKSFSFTLQNPSNNIVVSSATATATIVDNDFPVISIASANSTTEDIAGGVANFIVSLDQVCATRNVSFNYSTFAPASAVVASTLTDYTPIAVSTATITSGSTSTTIPLTITPDTIDEYDEILELRIASPSLGTLGNATSVVTITDDDASPSLNVSLTTASQKEGAATPAISFSVNLSGPSEKVITVNYATADITTTAGAANDYLGSSGTITLNPGGGLSQSYGFNALTDAIDEPTDETFRFTISNALPADITIGTASQIGTIIDGNAPGSLGFAIASGNPYTNLNPVSLNLAASNASEMYITNTSGCASGGVWETYSNIKSAWSLASLNSTTDVYVKFRDAQDNQTACLGDNIIHDNIAPTIVSVTSTSPDGIYQGSATINLSVSISEVVIIAGGSPSFGLDSGGLASYASGSGSNILGFTYTVGSTDYSPDLDFNVSTLNVPGGSTIKDSAGNNLNTLFPTAGGANSIAGTKALKIVGTPAVLAISDGPSFSYGNVELTSVSDKTFTLTNSSSSVPITALTASALAGSFNFTGGNYPGTGGTCSLTLSPLSNCTVVVRYSPVEITSHADVITISYNDGTASAAAANRNISGTGIPIVELAFSNPNYASVERRWNYYVKVADPTQLCLGNETGDYFSGCHHLGEKRKVRTGKTSCLNLTIADSRGVFDWECKIEAGEAIFYSAGLKTGKGLKDLIDFPVSWFNNSVEVRLSGTVIGAPSVSEAWWDNTLVPMLAASLTTSTHVVSTPGTIYVQNTNVNLRTVSIEANNIAVVTLPGITIQHNHGGVVSTCNDSSGLTTTANRRAVICAGSRKFLWIETHIEDVDTLDSDKAQIGLLFQNISYSRIQNTRVDLGGLLANANFGVVLDSSNSNFVDNLGMFKPSYGISLGISSNNILRNISVASAITTNLANSMIELNGSTNNRFSEIRLANGNGGTQPSFGIRLLGSSTQNKFSGLYISNLGGSLASSGILLSTGASNNFFTKVLITGTIHGGIRMGGGANNHVSYYTTTNNVNNGIFFDGNNSSSNSFYSVAVANHDVGINSITGFTGGSNLFSNIAGSDNGSIFNLVNSVVPSIYNGFLINGGNGNCTFNNAVQSGCTITSPVFIDSVSASLVGALNTADGQNPILTSGTPVSALFSLERWTLFQTPFRTWNNAAADFPNASARGFASTTAKLNDWRVKIGGVLHETSFSGNIGTPNGTLTVSPSGVPCNLSELQGNAVLTVNSKTFMKYAIEINSDRIGNNDGLCESNESCYYAPNIGAYQGDGDLYSNGYCTTSASAVSVINARIFKFPITGI